MLELIGLAAVIFLGIKYLPDILMFLVKFLFWAIVLVLVLKVFGFVLFIPSVIIF